MTATLTAGTSGAPLVTTAFYESMIGNNTGSTVEQSDLDAATVEVADWVHRSLAYGQWTETLYVNPAGMVYPSAIPIDTSQSITVSGQTGVVQPANVQGFGLWVGYAPTLPDLPVFYGDLPPQTTVTYWGGFQPVNVNTGPTPALPRKLARAICKVAYYEANPTVLGVPAGVTSTSSAGVSVSGDLSAFTVVDRQLQLDLAAFDRRMVKSF